MCAECGYAPECYACMVGVATGPESHAPCCPARGIPMPEQDGTFGPEWDEWERKVEKAKRAALWSDGDPWGDVMPNASVVLPF